MRDDREAAQKKRIVISSRVSTMIRIKISQLEGEPVIKNTNVSLLANEKWIATASTYFDSPQRSSPSFSELSPVSQSFDRHDDPNLQAFCRQKIQINKSVLSKRGRENLHILIEHFSSHYACLLSELIDSS